VGATSSIEETPACSLDYDARLSYSPPQRS
jgi:hypothetical protein